MIKKKVNGSIMNFANMNEAQSGDNSITAFVEVSPAEAAHNVDDYIVYNHIIYQVIDDISIGDTLVVNTNIEQAVLPEGTVIYSDDEQGSTSSLSYNDLSDKPQIAGTTLQGDKSLADLGIAGASDVDEVKNKSWSLGGGTSIANNTDLNDITTVGNYYATTQAAATLSHCPTTGGFKLKVLYDVRETAPTYIEQVFNPISSYDEYRRYKSGSAEWSDWHLTNCNLDEVKEQNAANTSAIEAIVNEYGAKNVLPFDLNTLKALNTAGTWNGNVYTINDGTFTVNVDSKGNLISIVANGTFNNNSNLYLINSGNAPVFESGKYILSGITGGSDTTYNILYADESWTWRTLTDGERVFDINVNRIRIDVVAGTLNNIVIKPMIRDTRITDPTYVPYVMTNEQLTERIVTTRHTGKTTANGGFLEIPKINGYYLASVTLDNLGGYLCSWSKYATNIYSIFPFDYNTNTGTLTFLYDFEISAVCTWIKE